MFIQSKWVLYEYRVQLNAPLDVHVSARFISSFLGVLRMKEPFSRCLLNLLLHTLQIADIWRLVILDYLLLLLLLQVRQTHRHL